MIDFKKNILPFILDSFLVLWVIFNISQSETETLFYATFLYFFIIIFAFFSIFKKASIPGDVNGWEKIFYLLGTIFIIYKFQYIKNLFIDKIGVTMYTDTTMLIEVFFFSIGALVLFMRIKEIIQTLKSFIKK